MISPIASQIAKTSQVIEASEAIRYKHPITPRIGVTGNSGVLNERSISGRLRRRLMTPALTIMNANSVPIEVASASCPSGTNAARILITTATMIVLLTGVCVLGLTLVKTFGSRPSRPIANRMRVWPYIVTSTTEKIEMTAPSAMIAPAQVPPVTSLAIRASTASPLSPSKSDGWPPLAPIAAIVTSRYMIVTTISEPMMASGRSRLGFLASSPAVEAASKPM